jgi:hypothetical protein
MLTMALRGEAAANGGGILQIYEQKIGYEFRRMSDVMTIFDILFYSSSALV